jgi:hypothetical protein
MSAAAGASLYGDTPVRLTFCSALDAKVAAAGAG